MCEASINEHSSSQWSNFCFFAFDAISSNLNYEQVCCALLLESPEDVICSVCILLIANALAGGSDFQEHQPSRTKIHSPSSENHSRRHTPLEGSFMLNPYVPFKQIKTF